MDMLIPPRLFEMKQWLDMNLKNEKDYEPHAK